jgi:capsular exopolysaccharide synthesis family protein
MTTVPVTVQERIPMPVSYAAGRPAAGGPAAGLSVGDLIRVLRQRMFLILFVWFFLTGATGALTYYLLKYHESYRAQTFVQVESPQPKTPMAWQATYTPVELMNRYVADEAQRIKSDEVLDAALGDAGVMETNWYAGEPNKSELLQQLKNELSVRPVPDTSFLAISFATRSREDAPRIVNTVVAKYLGKTEDLYRGSFRKELAEYKKEGERLRNEIEQIRRQKELFITESIGVPGATEGLNVAGEQWRALATEATRLEADMLQLRAAYENIRSLDPTQMVISPQMRAMIQADPQVAAMNNNLLSLDLQQQSLAARFGPSHRAVKNLSTEIAAMKQKLDEVLRVKEDEIRQYQLSSAETAYLNAAQAKLALDERLIEAQATQRDLDAKLAQYRSLEEKQLLLEDQHKRVADYTYQLALVTESEDVIRVRQMGQATPPLKRSFPLWELNMPVGSFLGLLLGVGLALLLELADTSIRTTRDVVRHVHIPILGTVPDLDDEEVPIDQIELATHFAPRSMIAEAFRAVRTNLLLSSPAERQRTVLVTSARPEEGKTTIAANLAIAIGQSGRRVLLVDANFHRPMLHQLFPKANREGLSNILIGRGKLEELVSPTDLPNLDVLTCGPIPPNPTELLTSKYMVDLVSLAADRYDQVIFDGPPVLLVSDALVLAGTLDGVILVCRAKASSRGVVQRARDQLERVNGRIFGAVLNAARVSRGGYFREQIRTYYDYQPEEVLTGGMPKALPGKDDAQS